MSERRRMSIESIKIAPDFGSLSDDTMEIVCEQSNNMRDDLLFHYENAIQSARDMLKQRNAYRDLLNTQASRIAELESVIGDRTNDVGQLQIEVDQLRAAVQAEREKCAKVCERIAGEWYSHGSQAANQCAAAIRNGEGEKA